MLDEFSPEVQQLVNHHMAAGGYASADDLLTTALCVLDERNRRLEALKRELKLGRDQIDRGECLTYDEVSLRQLFHRIQSEGMARYYAHGLPS